MSKGEQTRQRILEEAAPLFNQRGFDGCSMQDLMVATGMEKGGLYRHFASKEELAVEAFRYALRAAVKTRTDNLAHIPGAVDKLLHVVERFVELPSPIAGGCPLMNTAIDSDDGNPALRQLAREGIQTWKKRIANIVDDGLASGEIHAHVKSREIANSMVATLEGALMISRIEGTRNALVDARNMLSSVLEGIRSTS